MKRLVYSSPFVPAEWIAAHGLRASRLMPRGAVANVSQPAPTMGVCPFADAFVHAARRDEHADGVIMASACDQMRRVSEYLTDDLPVFLMHVPTTWQHPGAFRLYADELERLSGFLVRLGGVRPAPERLAETMQRFDAARGRLRAAQGHLSPKAFAEALVRFQHDGALDLDPTDARPRTQGIPLALVGGPLQANHFELFDVIEAVGGRVALDATAYGERTLPRPFDRRRLPEEPFGELADAYFGHLPDAFRRPNNVLYAWLKEAMQRRGIRGILFWHYTWCDTWHAEIERMREWAASLDTPGSHQKGVPLLAIDASNTSIDARTRSRVQAFVEVLS